VVCIQCTQWEETACRPKDLARAILTFNQQSPTAPPPVRLVRVVIAWNSSSATASSRLVLSCQRFGWKNPTLQLHRTCRPSPISYQDPSFLRIIKSIPPPRSGTSECTYAHQRVDCSHGFASSPAGHIAATYTARTKAATPTLSA